MTAEHYHKLYVDPSLKQKVQDKFVECYQKAEQKYGRTFIKPRLIFKTKGRTAGWAKYGKNVIDLNPVLLNENPDHIINQTTPHEVAHFIAKDVYGDMGHKHGWRSVMRVFGLNPDRTHRLDCSTVKEIRKAKRIERHTYVCSGCQRNYNLSTIIHNKIMLGNNRVCPRCRSRITSSEYLTTEVIRS